MPAEEFLRAAEEHCPGWLRKMEIAIFHGFDGKILFVLIISEGFDGT